jgi:hypothetical protein
MKDSTRSHLLRTLAAFCVLVTCTFIAFSVDALIDKYAHRDYPTGLAEKNERLQREVAKLEGELAARDAAFYRLFLAAKTKFERMEQELAGKPKPEKLLPALATTKPLQEARPPDVRRSVGIGTIAPSYQIDMTGLEISEEDMKDLPGALKRAEADLKTRQRLFDEYRKKK